MTIQNMGPREFGFVISEGNGHFSREAVTATGGSGGLVAGALVRDNAGTWQEIGVAETPEAIATAAVGENETADITVIVRNAEVHKAGLTYPDGASGAQITAMDTALAALGIVLR